MSDLGSPVADNVTLKYLQVVDEMEHVQIIKPLMRSQGIFL